MRLSRLFRMYASNILLTISWKITQTHSFTVLYPRYHSSITRITRTTSSTTRTVIAQLSLDETRLHQPIHTETSSDEVTSPSVGDSVTSTFETSTSTTNALNEDNLEKRNNRPSNSNYRNRTPREPRINNQEKYGVSLELPKTYVKCSKCSTCFAILPEDLGNGKGCRVECSVCSHSWFQSRERLMNLDETQEFTPLSNQSATRIASNLKAGRDAKFMGAIKFYVGNLSFDVTESDLRAVFEVIGDVGDVSIATGPEGRSRGFAFVTMMNEQDGDGCLKLDGYELKGRNINVKIPNNS